MSNYGLPPAPAPGSHQNTSINNNDTSYQSIKNPTGSRPHTGSRPSLPPMDQSIQNKTNTQKSIQNQTIDRQKTLSNDQDYRFSGENKAGSKPTTNKTLTKRNSLGSAKDSNDNPADTFITKTYIADYK